MNETDQRFPSLTAFYNADRRRMHSRERDGELQAALRGYKDVCGHPASLRWFLERTGTTESMAAA
jgi:hypothetical protein